MSFSFCIKRFRNSDNKKQCKNKNRMKKNIFSSSSQSKKIEKLIEEDFLDKNYFLFNFMTFRCNLMAPKMFHLHCNFSSKFPLDVIESALMNS